MIWAILAIVIAYAIGNIPFSVFVGNRAGHDLYNSGTNNPGASNVIRVAGWRWGLIAMVLDIAKGFIPTFVSLQIFDSYLTAEQNMALGCLVATAAMIGHVVPIGRKGGKGVATGVGAVLALYPVIGLIMIITWLLLMVPFRTPAISSMIATAILPIWVLIDHNYMWEIAFAIVFYVLIAIRHIPNIKRLLDSSAEHEEGVNKKVRSKYQQT